MKANEIPTSENELANWLEDYVTSRVTFDEIEDLARHMSATLRNRRQSDFGREAVQNIQAMSQDEFSAWCGARMQARR